MSDTEKLLTTKEVAERWGTNIAHVQRIPASELPRINIGTGKGRPTWRIRPSALANYERSRTNRG